MKLLNDIIYYIAFGLRWLISLLPLGVLYLFSTPLYLLLYYVVRYRRKVVRQNLTEAFPDLSAERIREVERGFYLYFCDLLMEDLKFFSMSASEMKRRMVVKGIERVIQSAEQGKSAAFFLGHNCNWEWISSMPLWADDKVLCMQLYHPLENKVADRLMDYVRSRFGGVNVPMKQSIRDIMKYQREGKPVIVGFIADQAPIWESLNYWLPFFGHDTPVMTGGERIARKLNMDCYYMETRRVRRGYYETEIKLMTDKPKEVPEFWITEDYYRQLEDNIRQQPSYWLWSHKRWRRTRQGYIDHLRYENRHEELSRSTFCDHSHPEGIPCLEWEKDNKK